MNEKIEKEARKCTLTDAELIEASEQWISDLAKSGGKKWVLRIPVDFDRDPDILFHELCVRLKNKHNAALSEAIEQLDKSGLGRFSMSTIRNLLEGLKK